MLTGAAVAVKIINKDKMKNKNMISKVPYCAPRSKDKSVSFVSLAILILSNCMRYLILQRISLSSWSLLPRGSFTSFCNNMMLVRIGPDFF